MGTIKIALLFNEENEKQRVVAAYLKSQKRCKTALITELIYEWLQRKTNIPEETNLPVQTETELLKKVKSALLEDSSFVEKLLKLADEKIADEENTQKSFGLDIDEELLLSGLAAFEEKY